MKILLSADPDLPVPPVLYGGIERIIDGLAAGLQARGHQIALVAHPDSTCAVEKMFPWPRLQSHSSWSHVSNALALKNAVEEFVPDVVHSFSRLFYLLAILPSKLGKVMSYQRFPTKRTVATALRLARGTLRFTGCSDFICRLGRSSGGTWNSIPNFVDLRAFTYVAHVASDAPLVFLSRIERIKGAHTAIAIARLARRRLILAGNHGSSGEEGRYWRERIEPELGHNGIEYIGPVDDRRKNELLGQAAALVVPVEWDEPFGIVFAEALACGTPVISCARGALPEIIEPGVEGFLIKDAAEGVAAVDQLKSIDRARCRRRIEEHFSSDRIIGRYEALYSDMLKGREAA